MSLNLMQWFINLHTERLDNRICVQGKEAEVLLAGSRNMHLRSYEAQRHFTRDGHQYEYMGNEALTVDNAEGICHFRYQVFASEKTAHKLHSRVRLGSSLDWSGGVSASTILQEGASLK